MVGIDVEMLLMKKIGFQLRSRTLRIALIEKSSAVAEMNALHPLALNVAI